MENTTETRIAIPVHGGRVSPVFDASRRVLLVDVREGQEVGRSEWELDAAYLPHRAGWLSDHQVDVLICGAICGPLAQMVSSHGIRIWPFVAGEVEEVIAAYLAGELNEARFLMPGCCGRRRRQRLGRRW